MRFLTLMSFYTTYLPKLVLIFLPKICKDAGTTCEMYHLKPATLPMEPPPGTYPLRCTAALPNSVTPRASYLQYTRRSLYGGRDPHGTHVGTCMRLKRVNSTSTWTMHRVFRRLTWSLGLAFSGYGGRSFAITELKGDWLFHNVFFLILQFMEETGQCLLSMLHELPPSQALLGLNWNNIFHMK